MCKDWSAGGEYPWKCRRLAQTEKSLVCWCDTLFLWMHWKYLCNPKITQVTKVLCAVEEKDFIDVSVGTHKHTHRDTRTQIRLRGYRYFYRYTCAQLLMNAAQLSFVFIPLWDPDPRRSREHPQRSGFADICALDPDNRWAHPVSTRSEVSAIHHTRLILICRLDWIR